MRRTNVCLLASISVVVLAFAASVLAQPSGLEQKYGRQLKTFEERARKQMQTDHMTGLAIALMIGDETWARGFGFADAEDGSPMKPESSFRMASVTKPMTAVGVLQLVEQGKMDIDAEIQTYVPYFPKKKQPVTVRQLLAHLGGISHYKDFAKELHIKEHKDTKEAIAIFQDFDLVAEPGTKFRYSSYGYNLLGAAIEGASGQPYGEYMREHVWGPAGMADTRMDDPRAFIPNRVRGYDRENGKLVNSEFVDTSSRFAAGGTRSTVVDLLKFARASLDGRLLHKTRLDEMMTPATVKDGHYTNYGLGWGIDPQNGRFLVAHSGAQNESRTMLMIVPNRGIAIAAATNFEAGDPYWYVQALVGEVFGERWDDTGGSAAFVPDKADRAPFRTARDAFQFGLAAYEKKGGALTQDPEKLRKAFAFFNRCAGRSSGKDAESEAKAKTCRDGLHPMTGEPIPAVGSYMAQTLSGTGGISSLDPYHAKGPAAFFADYIALYEKDSRVPSAYRFSSGFERQVAKWNRDWSRTFEPSVWKAVSGPDSARLKTTFANASVYPDLSSDLDNAALAGCRDGRKEEGLGAATLESELYPTSASSAVTLAATKLCVGEPVEQSRVLLQKARTLDEGEEFTGPGYLNRLGFTLAEAGRLEAGTHLLRLAIEIHPREANLYDSLGELEARAGRTDAAIEAYRKALELDPKLESSKSALEKLETKETKAP
jgi:CubicO group peptidase (beta-lactamase class C family)